MIKLSPEASKHATPDRVQNLYTIRASLARQLDEAKAAASSPHLTDWRSEARLLCTSLERTAENHEAKIAFFESAAPELEKAVAEEQAAVAEHAKAKAAYDEVGSLDRNYCLRRRDDVDVARVAMNIRYRARLAAVSNVAGLPNSSVVQEGPGRDVVDVLARFCLNKRFRPEYAEISKETWARFLALPESETMWLPYHAARVLKAAQEEFKKLGLRPDGVHQDDARKEAVVLHPADLVAELARLKSSREAHLRSQITQAQNVLDAAKQQVAVAS
jgi:hypothetical protein